MASKLRIQYVTSLLMGDYYCGVRKFGCQLLGLRGLGLSQLCFENSLLCF